MYPVSQEFHEKITAPERRVLGKVEITYYHNTLELPYNDPSLTYTGTWTFDQEEGGESTWGLPVYYATEEGAAVEFTFYGTRVALKTLTWMQNRGIAYCYIDGVQVKEIDLGIGGNLFKQTLYLNDGKLERGEHTVKIVCAGESGEFSVGTRIDIAGFIIEDDITETYEGDDLFYIHLLEEREDIDSGSIPVGNISSNEIDIRLDNSDRKFTPGNINSPLHGLLKKNLKVRAWLGVQLDSGDKEWVLLGVFYTIDWSAPESELYCHVTARDRLDQLRETDYSSAKALVAGTALPEPVFSRASVALDDSGGTVGANIPRFTPQAANMFNGITLDADVQKLKETIDGKSTTVYKLDASATTEVMSLSYNSVLRAQPGVTYRARFKAKWNKRLTFEMYVMDVTHGLIEIAPITWIKNPEPDIRQYQEYEWTVTMPDSEDEQFRANSCYFFRWYYSAEDDEGLAYLADIRLNAPGAVLIEEETKNKWTNGDFEKDSDGNGLADGWVVNQTGHSFWQYRDDYNWQVSSLPENTNESTPGIYRDITLEAGNWALSFYAQVNTYRGASLRVQYDDWNGAHVIPLHALPYNGGRKEKHIIRFALSSTRTIRFAVLHNGDNIYNRSSVFSLARFQLEKDAPTSFTPTTRAAEGLLLPSAGVLDNNQGTVEFDMYVGPGMRFARKTSTKQGATLFSQAVGYMQGIVPIQGFQLIHNPVDEQFEFWSTRYLYEDTIITTPDNLEEGMHRFAIRWSPYEMALFIDHEKKVSAIKPMLPSHLASYSSIGSRHNPLTGNHLGQVNGYIGTVRYSSRWRTNEELSASDPLSVDDSTTLFMGFDGDLVVEPLGTSLYALAEMVLLDAGLNQSEYRIDPQLRDYLVPCVYFEPQSHRETLRQIAEAGLAVVYCDREDGKIRVEIPEAPAVEEIEEAIYIQGASFPAEISTVDVYGISADDYFQKTNPEAEVKNSVSVITLPMIAGEIEEVYRSPEQITLSAGEERTITAFYDSAPCFNAEPATPGVGILILEATHYTWGMTVKLKNPDTISKTFELVVTARPLEVKGKQKITAKDETSITENGLRSYEFPDNPLVQSTSVAQLIADNLLQVYAPARRDLDMQRWRGNPALELGDVVCVPEYQRDGIDTRGYYIVVKQEIEWDSGLRAKLTGRRIG